MWLIVSDIFSASLPTLFACMSAFLLACFPAAWLASDLPSLYMCISYQSVDTPLNLPSSSKTSESARASLSLPQPQSRLAGTCLCVCPNLSLNKLQINTCATRPRMFRQNWQHYDNDVLFVDVCWWISSQYWLRLAVRETTGSTLVYFPLIRHLIDLGCRRGNKGGARCSVNKYWVTMVIGDDQMQEEPGKTPGKTPAMMQWLCQFVSLC